MIYARKRWPRGLNWKCPACGENMKRIALGHDHTVQWHWSHHCSIDTFLDEELTGDEERCGLAYRCICGAEIVNYTEDGRRVSETGCELAFVRHIIDDWAHHRTLVHMRRYGRR